MTMVATLTGRLRADLRAVNGRRHRTALRLFMVIVLARWAEHIVRAVQICVLGWPVPEARGVLGMPFPWPVTSEWLHYGWRDSSWCVPAAPDGRAGAEPRADHPGPGTTWNI